VQPPLGAMLARDHTMICICAELEPTTRDSVHDSMPGGSKSPAIGAFGELASNQLTVSVSVSACVSIISPIEIYTRPSWSLLSMA